MSHNSRKSIKVDQGPKPGGRFCLSQRSYSGASALRSGISEILIKPLNGSFSSKIKWIAQDADRPKTHTPNRKRPALLAHLHSRQIPARVIRRQSRNRRHPIKPQFGPLRLFLVNLVAAVRRDGWLASAGRALGAIFCGTSPGPAAFNLGFERKAEKSSDQDDASQQPDALDGQRSRNC